MRLLCIGNRAAPISQSLSSKDGIMSSRRWNIQIGTLQMSREEEGKVD